jgi:hypothetical protein
MRFSEIRLYQVIWGMVSSRVGKLVKEGGVVGNGLHTTVFVLISDDQPRHLCSNCSPKSKIILERDTPR